MANQTTVETAAIQSVTLDSLALRVDTLAQQMKDQTDILGTIFKAQLSPLPARIFAPDFYEVMRGGFKDEVATAIAALLKSVPLSAPALPASSSFALGNTGSGNWYLDGQIAVPVDAKVWPMLHSAAEGGWAQFGPQYLALSADAQMTPGPHVGLLVFDLPAVQKLKITVAADDALNAVSLNGVAQTFSGAGFKQPSVCTLDAWTGRNILMILFTNGGTGKNTSGFAVAIEGVK